MDFSPRGWLHSNLTPLSPWLKIRMIKEWNFSSLSSQTAKSCPWACKLSKWEHCREVIAFINILLLFAHYWGSKVEGHKVTIVSPLGPSLASAFWVCQRPCFMTPESPALSDHLSTCPCVFCSWWPFACPPEFLGLDLQRLPALFGMSSSSHELFSPGRDFSQGICASTLGAHTATAGRGGRASRQVMLSLQQLLRQGKIIPAHHGSQRMSLL